MLLAPGEHGTQQFFGIAQLLFRHPRRHTFLTHALGLRTFEAVETWDNTFVMYLYVCVCETLKRCKTFNCSTEGRGISLGLCRAKLPVKWDIELDQLDVPAIRFASISMLFFFVHGYRASQEPDR